MAIGGAKRNHRHIGTCGEGPPNYPEIAGFLEAEWGLAPPLEISHAGTPARA